MKVFKKNAKGSTLQKLERWEGWRGSPLSRLSEKSGSSQIEPLVTILLRFPSVPETKNTSQTLKIGEHRATLSGSREDMFEELEAAHK